MLSSILLTSKFTKLPNSLRFLIHPLVWEHKMASGYQPLARCCYLQLYRSSVTISFQILNKNFSSHLLSSVIFSYYKSIVYQHFTLNKPRVILLICWDSCGATRKELTCQCRRHKRSEFEPWVGKISWRRMWQPIPVFSPGESHGQRKLGGYNPWGCKKVGYN